MADEEEEEEAEERGGEGEDREGEGRKEGKTLASQGCPSQGLGPPVCFPHLQASVSSKILGTDSFHSREKVIYLWTTHLWEEKRPERKILTDEQ